MTKTGTVMGTPHYMSPEQVRGQKADARSDVFSLGAVFYELLSHHRPFEADSVHGVLFQILEQEPEPIRKWAPEVPAALVARRRAGARQGPRPALRRRGRDGAGARRRARRDRGRDGRGRRGAGAATMFQAGDATVVEPRPAAAVRGATALTLARAPARAAQSHMPRTVRPDPTVGGGPATAGPRRRGPLARDSLRRRRGVAARGTVGGVLWLRGRAAASPPRPRPARSRRSLRRSIVTNQVELARADLASHDYEAAARRAEDVLKLAPASAEARGVLDQAREAQRQIEEAVAEARGAFGRGDTSGGLCGPRPGDGPRPPAPRDRRALGRAEAALPAAGGGRRGDRRTGRGGRRRRHGRRRSRGSRRARSSPRRPTALFRRQDYAAAAQRYLESRDAFERAKRRGGRGPGGRAPAPRPRPSRRRPPRT